VRNTGYPILELLIHASHRYSGRSQLGVFFNTSLPFPSLFMGLSTFRTLIAAEPDDKLSWWNIVKLMGPGIMVCLADTDGPCLLVAANSGGVFQYSLLLTQLLLIPVLFMAQELTARLALYTGCGMTELIRKRFGKDWARFFCIYSLILCTTGFVSEVVDISLVLRIYGVPMWCGSFIVGGVTIFVVLSGNYNWFEIIGVTLGACQLIFVPLMFVTHVKWSVVGEQLVDYSWIVEDKRVTVGKFFVNIASNIGAVIMPWMLIYQQSATCEKPSIHKKSKTHLKIARIDTAVGSFLTQLVMGAMIITIAGASLDQGLAGQDASIRTANDIVERLEPYMGIIASRIFVSSGMIGASLTAALVISVCSAWWLTSPRSSLLLRRIRAGCTTLYCCNDWYRRTQRSLFRRGF